MSTPGERAAQGKLARKRASRSSHGAWIPSADRPDPVAVLERQGVDRVQELLPVRYARMADSPFAFLRGAAAVMAGDLAVQWHTGLTVQLCGDAHLLNFGLFASPERALLFGLDDFDETCPGPFEWDVKRLAASVAVASRDNGHTEGGAHDACLAAVAAYRTSMRRLAGLGELAVWYERTDTHDLLPLVRSARARKRVTATLDRDRARHRTSLQALGKLTEVVDGERRIIHDPPLLEPAGAELTAVRKIFGDYRSTLSEERRLLLDRYHFVDAARKAAGVGSVGTRCFVVLLAGRDIDDPLFLQIKEADRSVLEQHLPAGPYVHPGHRVVAGQRLLQAAGDIFLGWMTGPQGRAYYWRRLRDMKGSADVEAMSPKELRSYARLCGTALALAHARSGDRIAIAAYLGGSDTFDRAIADFALRYAVQNAADHAALGEAIAAGLVSASDASAGPR
ncbi:DUF2252 domain-containing protein [Streptomyces sp. NPDC048436]|uniref:DUF2252 domain-containing protein n=1 Tax=Streptomyces sp. NPDC048436 TaxID=3365550 RepID=UPI0037111C9B